MGFDAPRSTWIDLPELICDDSEPIGGIFVEAARLLHYLSDISDKQSKMTCKNWFQSEVGRLVVQQEQRELAAAMPDYCLSKALQIGMPAGISLLEDINCLDRVVLTTAGGATSLLGDLLAEPVNLPLANQSIELVLLHHILETSAHPHALLREASRVLIDGGLLAVLAFNPWSFAGLWRITQHRKSPQDQPWQYPFIPAGHIQDWMTVLGFELVCGRWLLYRPFLANAWVWQRLRVLEAAGDRWWPALGGVSLLVAKKTQPGMWLLRNRGTQYLFPVSLPYSSHASAACAAALSSR